MHRNKVLTISDSAIPDKQNQKMKIKKKKPHKDFVESN